MFGRCNVSKSQFRPVEFSLRIIVQAFASINKCLSRAWHLVARNGRVNKLHQNTQNTLKVVVPLKRLSDLRAPSRGVREIFAFLFTTSSRALLVTAFLQCLVVRIN